MHYPFPQSEHIQRSSSFLKIPHVPCFECATGYQSYASYSLLDIVCQVFLTLDMGIFHNHDKIRIPY